MCYVTDCDTKYLKKKKKWKIPPLMAFIINKTKKLITRDIKWAKEKREREREISKTRNSIFLMKSSFLGFYLLICVYILRAK